MSDRQRDRVNVLRSSLTYRDDRLSGFAAALMEVIVRTVPPQQGMPSQAETPRCSPGLWSALKPIVCAHWDTC